MWVLIDDWLWGGRWMNGGREIAATILNTTEDPCPRPGLPFRAADWVSSLPTATPGSSLAAVWLCGHQESPVSVFNTVTNSTQHLLFCLYKLTQFLRGWENDKLQINCLSSEFIWLGFNHPIGIKTSLWTSSGKQSPIRHSGPVYGGSCLYSQNCRGRGRRLGD